MLAAEGYRVPFGASYAPGREREFADHALEVLAMRRGRPSPCSATAAGSSACSPCISMASCCTPSGSSTTHPTPTTGPRRPFLTAVTRCSKRSGASMSCWASSSPLPVPRPGHLHGRLGAPLVHSKVHLNAVLARSGDLCFRRDLRGRSQAPHVPSGRHIRLGRAPGAPAQPLEAVSLQLARGPAGQGHRGGVLVLPRHRLAAHARRRDGLEGQVYLNVRGHRPEGIIPAGQLDAERERVAGCCRGCAIRAPANRSVKRVLTRDEALSRRGGEQCAGPDRRMAAPDTPARRISRGQARSRAGPAGSVERSWNESALLVLGRMSVPARFTATLEDVTPTVLHALGVPIPAGLEGSVLPL